MTFAANTRETHAWPALAVCREPAEATGPDFGKERREELRRASLFAVPTRYLSTLLFALLNMAVAALLGAAHFQGWLAHILEADDTGMSLAIFGVFLAGLALCGVKLVRLDRELAVLGEGEAPAKGWARAYLTEVAGRDSGSRALTAASLRLKLSNHIAIVRLFANSLVILGLIGTVIGFIIAFSGVDSTAAADPAAIGPMVTTLIRGLSVALYTTLVGSLLNVWLGLNQRLLTSAAVGLAAATIARGESDANA